MQVLGRIIQAVGWLWFATGIAGSVFDLGSFSPFPGLVLIFIARAIRSQARREPLPELAGPESVDETDSPERILNTERPRPVPAPAPRSVSRSGGHGEDAQPQVEPKADQTDGLLERIAMAGTSRQSEGVEPPRRDSPSQPKSESTAPLSSAEMIAQARRRWDSKPR